MTYWGGEPLPQPPIHFLGGGFGSGIQWVGLTGIGYASSDGTNHHAGL